MAAAYGAMKPTKLGLEEPQEQLHRIRITLSSKNVKNLEKAVCTGPPGYRYVDCSLPDGIAKIDRRRSIEGEKGKKKKKKKKRKRSKMKKRGRRKKYLALFSPVR
ncbi:hypothetical protein GW17_00039235, partial [Ensete ventricosum]